MPRKVLSLIAMTLAGCVTTTRIPVAPTQLEGLAGMNSHDHRQLIPPGRHESVTVRGSDEFRLQTRGDLALQSSSERDWARLDTLRWTPSVVSGQPQSQTVPTRTPVDAIGTAEIKISQTNWTPLVVTGVVLGVVAVVAMVGFAAIAASGGFKLLSSPLY